MSTVTIRVDEETKRQVSQIVEDLGLDLSTTVRAFFRQIIREQRIPLNLSYEVPNQDTMEALRESEQIIANPGGGRFQNAQEMYRALGI